MSALHTLIRHQTCQNSRPRFISRLKSQFRTSICRNSSKSTHQNPSAHTIAQQLASFPSETFLKSVSTTENAIIESLDTSKAYSVKRTIADLLNDKSYEALLRTIAKWTSAQSQIPWQRILSQREMSYILSFLIEYQKDILLKASTTATIRNSNETKHDMQRAQVREARNQIREIYASLLSASDTETLHLYDKSSRVFEVSAKNDEDYCMTPADYENLITLELNNAKLDLASRWFRRVEVQFGENEYHEHMTLKLWLLKFKVFTNGQSSLWRVDRSAVNDLIINPRRSKFKASMKWLDLFDEFSKKQALFSDRSKILFSNDVVAVMLASISYDGSISQVEKLVEVNWGILPNGKSVGGFVKPTPADPLFPDIDVVTLVAVAMLYNKQFVSAMSYINSFQHMYGVELERGTSKQFWDQVFRWAEIATAFSEERAFQFYVSDTGSNAFAGSSFGLADEFPTLLAEARKSAEFDYEGFLKFVADLRKQRVGLLSELWKCFHECGPTFSVRPYWTILKIAREFLQKSAVLDPWESEQQCSGICYDILEHLSVQQKKHVFAPDSFNATMMPDVLPKIRELYTSTMRILIHAKGSAGHLDQIPHVISKWSLDAEMRSNLSNWAQRNEEQYLKRMNELEAESLREDEEEGLLDLM